MNRIDCLRALAPYVTDEDYVVISLGGTALEWNAVRPGDNNLYLVAMGSNTPVALGLALAAKHRRVILLETDGALLLSLGALATLGNVAPPNLRAFVFDNEGYERVRHDISATKGKTDLAQVAQACGIPQATTVRTIEAFADAARTTMGGSDLSFTVVKVEPGIADVPGRKSDGLEDKYRFVRYVERLEGVSILSTYRARLE
ncbi:MAG TPA: thiamine pyrophosphate-dependent enzyme [Candidatus Limnocylindrales bacterium]|nr:thiamine pyrophosphate-dependent enzyme [Candidatus Limnocylindrales bacterium]